MIISIRPSSSSPLLKPHTWHPHQYLTTSPQYPAAGVTVIKLVPRAYPLGSRPCTFANTQLSQSMPQKWLTALSHPRAPHIFSGYHSLGSPLASRRFPCERAEPRWRGQKCAMPVSGTGPSLTTIRSSMCDASVSSRELDPKSHPVKRRLELGADRKRREVGYFTLPVRGNVVGWNPARRGECRQVQCCED